MNKFEALKLFLKEVNEETKQQIIGAGLLILMVVLGYWAGLGEGRKAERQEIPRLQQLEDRYQKIEKAIDKNCAASAVLQQSRADEQKREVDEYNNAHPDQPLPLIQKLD